MLTFFRTLIPNILGAYKERRWILHVLAIVLTTLIVITGFDWYWFNLTGIDTIRNISFIAVGLGSFVPIVLPVCILAISALRRDRALDVKGWLLGQAAFIALFITSLYKAFTGRVQPSFGSTLDISREFQFGWLRHGIFWGWPSSHTATAFALAVAFLYIFPKSPWKWVLLIYAIYVGLSVSTTIHWFSEFVAGVLVGISVGIAVGKSYKKISTKA